MTNDGKLFAAACGCGFRGAPPADDRCPRCRARLFSRLQRLNELAKQVQPPRRELR